MKTTRQNPFDGNGSRAEFARIAYKQLMSRKWISYETIMAAQLKVKELPTVVSKCPKIGELKKAFPSICNAIKEQLGDIIEERGKRNIEYRYVGTEDDPLADMLNAKTIKDLGEYFEFCQDSAGFFPSSWLEYFFKNSRDLLNIKQKKQKGEQIVSSSVDRILTNIELLPRLYQAIKMQQVIYIDYKPFGKECERLIFHPHLLKEYNGRWQLFGHAEDKNPKYGYNIALDRIQNTKFEKKPDAEYKKAPAGFYEEFFKNIVGVSHIEGHIPTDINIRAHKSYMFNLTSTKPIHQSQKILIPFGRHEDGEYGEFTVHVETNNEFFGRILQMGADLEIVSPESVRSEFKQRVKALADLYNKDSE